MIQHVVRLSLIWALCLLAHLALAQTAKPLGTLIFTPQERIELERAREDLAIARPNAAATLPPVTAVTVDGTIRRSDGTQSTLSTWLNGSNAAPTAVSGRLVGPRADGVALRAGDTVRTLKPGQTLLPDGTIRDAFDHPDARVAALRGKTPVVIREITETTRIETVAPSKLKQAKVKRSRAAKAPKAAKKSGTKAPAKKPSAN